MKRILNITIRLCLIFKLIKKKKIRNGKIKFALEERNFYTLISSKARKRAGLISGKGGGRRKKGRRWEREGWNRSVR